jgi:hypothetical protein
MSRKRSQWDTSGDSNDADDDADESFVSIGTMQPMDIKDVKAKDRNAFLPVFLQEVSFKVVWNKGREDYNLYMHHK